VGDEWCEEEVGRCVTTGVATPVDAHEFAKESPSSSRRRAGGESDAPMLYSAGS